MTSADFDHTDKLAGNKKEKLEWVTPKMTFMVAEDTGRKQYRDQEFDPDPDTNFSNSMTFGPS